MHTNLYDADIAQQIDRDTIAGFGLPGPVLMEQAGRAVAEAAVRMQPDRVFVLCGKGNNGGDGFIVARWLQQHGITVEVHSFTDPDDLTGDAAWAYRLWTELGKTTVVDVESVDPVALFRNASPRSLVIDALFGTGLTTTLRDPWPRLLRSVNEVVRDLDLRVVAIDVPSGVHAGTGELLGTAVQATTTVTMGFDMLGLRVWPGRGCAGSIEVVDLGYPKHILETYKPAAKLLTPSGFDLPRRDPNTHKGRFGNVVVVGGSPDMPGAPILAARGALRGGAGRVFVAQASDIQTSFPDEIMKLTLPRKWEALPTASFDAVVDVADAIVCGPGLGRDEGAVRLVANLLAASATIPIVLDADALYAIQDRLGDLPQPERLVLTPHPGEAGVLLQRSAKDIQAQRWQAFMELQERSGTTVVLKGAGSIVGDGGVRFVSPFADAALAVPGSGDVLSGVIAAMSASGLAATDAAAAGVWLHGKAGSFLAPAGNVAGDIAASIPKAFAAC